MSEFGDKIDEQAQAFKGILNSPEIKKSKSFYKRNKTAVNTTALIVAAYALHKRGLRKNNVKLLKEMQTMSFPIELDPIAFSNALSTELNSFVSGMADFIEDTVWSSVSSAIQNNHMQQARKGLDEIKALRSL